EILRWPWAGDPVRKAVGRGAAGATGEVHDGRDAQLLCEQDGSAAGLDGLLCKLLDRIERVAVAAKGADGEAVVLHGRLKGLERGRILKHGELAVRTAGIVAGAELNGGD